MLRIIVACLILHINSNSALKNNDNFRDNPGPRGVIYHNSNGGYQYLLTVNKYLNHLSSNKYQFRSVNSTRRRIGRSWYNDFHVGRYVGEEVIQAMKGETASGKITNELLLENTNQLKMKKSATERFILTKQLSEESTTENPLTNMSAFLYWLEDVVKKLLLEIPSVTKHVTEKLITKKLSTIKTVTEKMVPKIPLIEHNGFVHWKEKIAGTPGAKTHSTAKAVATDALVLVKNIISNSPPKKPVYSYWKEKRDQKMLIKKSLKSQETLAIKTPATKKYFDHWNENTAEKLHTQNQLTSTTMSSKLKPEKNSLKFFVSRILPAVQHDNAAVSRLTERIPTSKSHVENEILRRWKVRVEKLLMEKQSKSDSTSVQSKTKYSPKIPDGITSAKEKLSKEFMNRKENIIQKSRSGNPSSTPISRITRTKPVTQRETQNKSTTSKKGRKEQNNVAIKTSTSKSLVENQVFRRWKEERAGHSRPSVLENKKLELVTTRFTKIISTTKIPMKKTFSGKLGLRKITARESATGKLANEKPALHHWKEVLVKNPFTGKSYSLKLTTKKPKEDSAIECLLQKSRQHHGYYVCVTTKLKF